MLREVECQLKPLAAATHRKSWRSAMRPTTKLTLSATTQTACSRDASEVLLQRAQEELAQAHAARAQAGKHVQRYEALSLSL